MLPTPQNKPSQTLTRTHVPHDVRAEKIAKGLCFYCDQKFARGHKCQFKEPQLFIVEFLGDSEEGDKDYEELNDSEMQSTEPVISVNALAGP